MNTPFSHIRFHESPCLEQITPRATDNSKDGFKSKKEVLKIIDELKEDEVDLRINVFKKRVPSK